MLRSHNRFEELLKIYNIPKIETFEDKEKSYHDCSENLEFQMNEVNLNIKPCESLFNKLSFSNYHNTMHQFCILVVFVSSGRTFLLQEKFDF